MYGNFNVKLVTGKSTQRKAEHNKTEQSRIETSFNNIFGEQVFCFTHNSVANNSCKFRRINNILRILLAASYRDAPPLTHSEETGSCERNCCAQ